MNVVLGALAICELPEAAIRAAADALGVMTVSPAKWSNAICALCAAIASEAPLRADPLP